MIYLKEPVFALFAVEGAVELLFVQSLKKTPKLK